MVDIDIEGLARRAGTGDLRSAKRLLKALESQGREEKVPGEAELIFHAVEIKKIIARSQEAQDIDDLLSVSELSKMLCDNILKYFEDID